MDRGCIHESVMRAAAIDIGTNTILMLIGDVDAHGHLQVVRDEHHIARLGKGVDASGRIDAAAVSRTLELLRSYKNLAEADHCERIYACGTSALRDATNRGDVL